jgi:hypothetical protein
MPEFMIALTHQNVQAVLDNVTFSGDAPPFLLVETMQQQQARPVLGNMTYVIFDRRDDARYDVNLYASGRVFAAEGELRWRQDEGTFQIVYIGEKAQAEALLHAFQPNAAQPRELQQSRETGVYLWGRKVEKQRVCTELLYDKTDNIETENIFIELRIPQYLCYPFREAPDQSRVQLNAREFYDAAGRLEYYRFCACTIISPRPDEQ